jgi:hypothetical protein
VAPESTRSWTSAVEAAMATAERTKGHAALLDSSFAREEGIDVWRTEEVPLLVRPASHNSCEQQRHKGAGAGTTRPSARRPPGQLGGHGPLGQGHCVVCVHVDWHAATAYGRTPWTRRRHQAGPAASSAGACSGVPAHTTVQ